MYLISSYKIGKSFPTQIVLPQDWKDGLSFIKIGSLLFENAVKIVGEEQTKYAVQTIVRLAILRVQSIERNQILTLANDKWQVLWSLWTLCHKEPFQSWDSSS